MVDSNRQAVVILGMHRSGTSAIAGTAVRLGLAAPKTPLPSAEDNPGGFYESLPIVNINYLILRTFDCAWNVCLTFEPGRLAADIEPRVHQVMADVVRAEFPTGPGFVMKDPRLCLTLPAWRPVLDAVNAGIHALIVLRHPKEVIRSLALRNSLPEDETAPHWLHHMLEAERATRGLPRAFVAYPDLLRDWRATMTRAGQTANIVWPGPVDAENRELDSFLASSGRHHSAVDATALLGPPGVREWVNAAWGMFNRLADDPVSSVALGCLDHLHAQFLAWRTAAFPPGFKAWFPPDEAPVILSAAPLHARSRN